ncbi:hypothetical protein EC900091_5255, partial [Escherichia coli 90.0091]
MISIIWAYFNRQIND